MRKIYNNIISHNNLGTKSTEYIYNFDMIWLKKSFGSIDVAPGFIVENVEQEETGSYTFNIKDDIDQEIYHCSYGWAFVENTIENKETLRLIDIEKKKLDETKLNITILNLKLKGLFDYSKELTKKEIRKIKLKNLE